jgi:phosphohistidine phosphatase SixA
LYLVRHAIAAERGEEWPDDTKRPLTERGIQRFREARAGLKALEVRIDEIFTSPLVAREADRRSAGGGTAAEAFSEAVARPGARAHASAVMVQLEKPRSAGASRSSATSRISASWPAYLLGGKRPLPFRKGGICRIDVEGLASTRAGSLIWFVPPRVLRKLAD